MQKNYQNKQTNKIQSYVLLNMNQEGWRIQCSALPTNESVPQLVYQVLERFWLPSLLESRLPSCHLPISPQMSKLINDTEVSPHSVVWDVRRNQSLSLERFHEKRLNGSEPLFITLLVLIGSVPGVSLSLHLSTATHGGRLGPFPFPWRWEHTLLGLLKVGARGETAAAGRCPDVSSSCRSRSRGRQINESAQVNTSQAQGPARTPCSWMTSRCQENERSPVQPITYGTNELYPWWTIRNLRYNHSWNA